MTTTKRLTKCPQKIMHSWYITMFYSEKEHCPSELGRLSFQTIKVRDVWAQKHLHRRLQRASLSRLRNQTRTNLNCKFLTATAIFTLHAWKKIPFNFSFSNPVYISTFSQRSTYAVHWGTNNSEYSAQKLLNGGRERKNLEKI